MGSNYRSDGCSLPRPCSPCPTGRTIFSRWLLYGGLIAFEMAHLLHARGQQVALLALIDTWEASTLLPFLHTLWNRLLHFMHRQPQARLRSLQEKQQKLTRIVREFLRPELYNPEEQRFRHFYRINMKIVRAYQPQPYPGSITFFRTQERLPDLPPDAERRWTRLAVGGLEVYQVPGDHYSLLASPHVQVLARRLQECLQRAQYDSHPRQVNGEVKALSAPRKFSLPQAA